MSKWATYINGNYKISINTENGTKIRETLHPDYDKFIAEFPECMDIKITNYCDMNCSWCHEDSNTKGEQGDILNPKFIDTLRPYTEIAIGGGNPISHPNLIPFLHKLKNKNIIANMTVNQIHFEKCIDDIDYLIKNGLVKGLGISLVKVNDNLIDLLQKYDNAVLHVINGIVDICDLEKLYGHRFKVLILGYKQFRKGNDFYSSKVEENKLKLYNSIASIIKGFKVVSFDNLAIEQIDVRRLLSKREWDEFYMGDDGINGHLTSASMYIDLVDKKFAVNSCSNQRYNLLDDVVSMYDILRCKYA